MTSLKIFWLMNWARIGVSADRADCIIISFRVLVALLYVLTMYAFS